MSKIHALLIDPQWDFCHAGIAGYDPTNPNPDPIMDFAQRPGALYVPGAEADCMRTAEMIIKGASKIDDISLTMDSHRPIHVAHSDYWRDDQGNQPTPLADIIDLADVDGQNPKWRTYNPADQDWVTKVYLPELKSRNRNPLTIWPKHCIWGSGGWQVYPCIQQAVQTWCEGEWGTVNVKFKGQNCRTEWFSAVGADVEDPNDRQTGLDTDFVEQFKDADLFVFMGQALSHCMRWTFTDIAEYLGDKFVKKCLLIEDGTSSVPVPQFIQDGKDFVEKYKAMGMQTCTAAQFVSDV